MKLPSKSVISSGTSSLLQEAFRLARHSLDAFINRGSSFELAFGKDYDHRLASRLFSDFVKGNFSAFPEIRILSAQQLGSTNGGFSSSENTIYLNQGFLNQNRHNPNAVASVLLEEIGHFIDSKINQTRSEGDEGEIFARLVQGEKLSPAKLAALRAENDHRQIMLDGT